MRGLHVDCSMDMARFGIGMNISVYCRANVVLELRNESTWLVFPLQHGILDEAVANSAQMRLCHGLGSHKMTQRRR